VECGTPTELARSNGGETTRGEPGIFVRGVVEGIVCMAFGRPGLVSDKLLALWSTKTMVPDTTEPARRVLRIDG